MTILPSISLLYQKSLSGNIITDEIYSVNGVLYIGINSHNAIAYTSGISGLSGTSGYSGVSGQIGSIGISGYSGVSGEGVSGFSGYSGTNGSIGVNGVSGYSGFSGSSGVSGYSGIDISPSSTVTLTNKRITKRVLSITLNTATPTIDTDSYDVIHITSQSTNITSFTTNLSGTPVDGDKLLISITDTGTPITITWGASFENGADTLPTGTVASTRLDIGLFWNTDTSKWRCMAKG